MDLASRAKAIHAEMPVFDGHNDLAWAIRTAAGGDLEAADPSRHLPGFHTDIPRMLEGGVGAQFWSVYVPADSAEPYRRTIEQIELVRAMVARDDRLAMATTAAEVDAARGAGKLASLLGAEGGHSIEGSLDKLEDLADRGVRYLTLTHSDSHDWADSATDVARHGGLSDFGREVVRAMNRLGVIVDISHVSADTMWDALSVSSAPLIASHSNAAALAPHPRNVPDDVLATVGERGGVVMIVFFPGFVVRSSAIAMGSMFDVWRAVRAEHSGDEAAIAAALREMEATLELDAGTVSDVADHIEHIAEVAGVEAVGIGSDFDGMTMTVAGLEDVATYPRITEELLRRGWSEGDVRMVLGGNTRRVLADVEAVAR